jgi:signal transduction histidine kinase
MEELKRYALVYAGFALALSVLAAVEWIAYRNLKEVTEADRRETQTYQVIRELDRFLLVLTDMSSGVYSFVITGKEEYLEPYHRVRDQIEERLLSLRNFRLANPMQQKRLQEVEALTWERLSVMQHTIDLRRTDGFPAAYRMIMTAWDKRVTEKITERVAEAQREEERLLREGVEAKTAETEKTLRALLVGGAMSFVLLLMVIVFLRMELTRRAIAEKELRKHREHLEELIAERTKDIESFDYSVSHNLRGPLRSIDGFSQMLLEDYAGKLGGEGENYLRRIRSSAQYMGQLIEDLLALSRITRKELQITEADLSAIALATVAHLRLDHPGREVETVIQDHIEVHGDETLLKTAVKHLLENAWKYTSPLPGARIEFGMHPEAESTIYFVRDNGIGFDMRFADIIFLPFHRLHDETVYPGTGIGLSIVKRIIQRHGGKIWVESEPEKGTTFYFTLNEPGRTPGGRK